MHSLTFYVGRLRRSEINEANVSLTKRPIKCLLVLAGDPFLTSFSFYLCSLYHKIHYDRKLRHQHRNFYATRPTTSSARRYYISENMG